MSAAKTDPRFDLEPPSSAVHLWLFALAVALPVVITAIALAWASASDAPKSLIAGNLALTNAVVMIAVVALTVAIWWWVHRALQRHRLDIGEDGIALRTTFYRRALAWAELDLDAARVVDLREHTALKPLLKTNATALPGFRSGWFRLRNGRKALVATAASPRVVFIRTRSGYDLLLQARQPQALLDHLRAMAAPPRPR